MKSKFARFVVVGGLAASVNIITRVLLTQFMPFELAIVLAYFAGMATAFLLSREFVFEQSSRGVVGEASRFALVNLFAVAQVWIVSVGLAKWVFPALGWTFHPEFVAHVIGVGSPILTSYYLHKHFTFGVSSERRRLRR